MKNYHKKMLNYYSICDSVIWSNKWSSSFKRRPKPFGTFDDKAGYNGRIPSVHYLTTLLTDYVEGKKDFYDYEVQRRAGKIYKFDHCFKPLKHMFKVDDTPVFRALYTGINEYEEIRLNALTQGSGFEFSLPPLAAMFETIKACDDPIPELVYTDRCCGDRNSMEVVFPSLQENLDPATPLPLPEDTKYFVLSKDNASTLLNAKLEPILSFLELNTLLVGLDSEWGRRAERADVIQFSYYFGGNAAVCVIQVPRNGNLPANLKVFLQHPNVVWGSNYASNEFKMIFQRYELELNGKLVSLNNLAKEKGHVSTAQISLDKLARKILKYDIPKGLANSEWNNSICLVT